MSLRDVEQEDSAQGKDKTFVFEMVKYWTSEAIKEFIYQHFDLKNEAKEYFEKEICWKLVGRARFTTRFANSFLEELKKKPTSKSDPDSILIPYLKK